MKSEDVQKKVLVVILVLLLAANIVLLGNWYQARSETREGAMCQARMTANTKILTFLRFFVEKVIRADGEVSFNDRLILENLVQGLNNGAISAEWQKFVDSKTNTEAQRNLKSLLDVLIKEVK